MSSLFDDYISQSSFDELFDAQKNIRGYWKNIVEDIEKAGLQTLQAKQDDINWYFEDNGVTFNIYENFDESSSRLWSMDPIPFVIDKEESETIKKGLLQRAKLLNLILKDLYGEQKLLKENIIPAEVVFGHSGFLTQVFDFGFKEEFALYFYAADMARGPDGKMWIINDRTQAPSGLGYTIENRLTMNTVSKELYPNVYTKKLFPFLNQYKKLLKTLAKGDTSTAALLTPGAHNETYFEHAYLASFLQIDLVQGNDLLSKNGSLWLKSLSGLKKINTLVRRVDDTFCDPLELREDSRLGVAGLVEAMRQENLSMINPVGSAVLENIGLNPFMERICEYFLKENLILPQIATWWCGQKKELDFVLKNFEKLIIKKIDRAQHVEVYFGRKLSVEDRKKLLESMLKSPNRYVAQEEIGFSTTPCYVKGKIEPRNAVVRMFALKSEEGYSVMNGGLVRVSASKDSLLVSSQKGGTSKDLWILGDKADDIVVDNPLQYTQYVETSIDKIPTPKAENLFWLGRYLARSIATTRLILLVIKKNSNFYRTETALSKETKIIFQNVLTHVTMTYPGFLEREKNRDLGLFPMREIISVVKEGRRVGSLAFTFSMLANVNISLKDILAFESAKLFEKMQRDFGGFVRRKSDSSLVVVNELEQFLTYLMAYKELVRESIFKEQGLILYDIGYKIEMALLLISEARSMLCMRADKFIGHDILEGMLNAFESFNAYRAHYRSSLTLINVVDFLVFNPQFPKSLTYMANRLLKEFKELPKAKKHLTTYEKPIAQAELLLCSAQLDKILQIDDDEGVYTNLDQLLSTLGELFMECANEFSNTYFAHYDE
jgi:uncharacterized circularly permuted ATP-grasp superfamily protein/uncharacterized alpha-E superfamily protein